MLVELNEAFLRAEADDQVRVVIFGGMGKMFTSGHDMGSPVAVEERLPGPSQHPTRQVNGGARSGAEQLMLQEWHYYFENTRRWRNLRKITIAQVHGTVYAAGLMLMWACDLIVAADDTSFAGVVGTRLGMCGVEYFAHPWEFGPRRAKELLLTGAAMAVGPPEHGVPSRRDAPGPSAREDGGRGSVSRCQYSSPDGPRAGRRRGRCRRPGRYRRRAGAGPRCTRPWWSCPRHSGRGCRRSRPRRPAG